MSSKVKTALDNAAKAEIKFKRAALAIARDQTSATVEELDELCRLRAVAEQERTTALLKYYTAWMDDVKGGDPSNLYRFVLDRALDMSIAETERIISG